MGKVLGMKKFENQKSKIKSQRHREKIKSDFLELKHKNRVLFGFGCTTLRNCHCESTPALVAISIKHR